MRILWMTCLGICSMALIAKASTLAEDYTAIKPDMPMLAIGSPASLYLLETHMEKGNSVAYYMAGNIYEKGEVVPKDEAKAFELYTKGADKNPLARLALADMYATGRGTKPDLPKAIELYNQVLHDEDETLKKEAAQKIILLHDLLEKEAAFQKQEAAALTGNPLAMMQMAEYCLEAEKLVCAYVWLTLGSEQQALKENHPLLLESLQTLTGEMTMPELTAAEEEIAILRPIIEKAQTNTPK